MIKHYKLTMNDEHRNLIIESLNLNKALFNFYFHTIIEFVISEANEKWIVPDCDQDWGFGAICKTIEDFKYEFGELKNLDLSSTIERFDGVIGKIDQEIFSDNEICIIINSLDFSSRIICGQLLEISNVLRFSTIKTIETGWLELFIGVIKSSLFPELNLHASYSIYDTDTPLKPRICYEIIQVLRHEIWKNTEDRYEHVVSASPVHHETEFPLIEIELLADVGQAILDNPDLPEEFVKDSLEGLKEADGGLTEEYDVK
jgi:hypothetical protein